MRTFVVSVAVLLVLLPTASNADSITELERKQQELFESIAPSVVFLSGDGMFGSGFFVTERLVLTNAHVVEGRDRMDVVLIDGRRLSGKVVQRAAHDIDLALVEVPLSGSKPLSLEVSSSLRVGGWVASVGHGMGGIWTFTTGMISNIYPLGAERPVFQTQIPLNPGNSGGPVFDRNGRVVGIVTAGLKNTNSINFAIRSAVAFQELPQLSEVCSCFVVRAPPGVPIFVDGEMRGKGPRLVVPAERRSYEVFVVVGKKLIEKTLTYPAEREVDVR